METGKKVQSEGSEKTKQEIMAERKAKKAEKAAKKSQPIKTTEHGAVTILSESIQSAKETSILENYKFLRMNFDFPYFSKYCES